MFNILIAPNSFKNSLTANEVADAIALGFKESELEAVLQNFPIADGGDHTSFLITDYLKGKMNSLKVSGAYLQETDANYGLVNKGKTAVIEVAQTSGFKSIQGKLKSPINSSTKGLGEIIQYNIDDGIFDFIICLGGSATVDGGIGMLQALGMKFLDKNHTQFHALPSNFEKVQSIDLEQFNKTISKCSFTVLCDVENKLLGEEGAAKFFGPQKGADEADMKSLENFLIHFEKLTAEKLGKSLDKVVGGGAAGGLGAVFSVFMNAILKKGTNYFCELTGFESMLSKADLLITGEGSIDNQSMRGKAPIVVAKLARKYDIPVIGLAGSIPLKVSKDLQKYFTMLLAIGNSPNNLKNAIKNTKSNLIRTAKQIGFILKQSC